MSSSNSIRRNVRLKLTQGLHIRACSNVIAIVSQFAGKVSILYNDRSADASSMFDLMQLAAVPDSELVIEANGDGAETVLDQLEELFSKPTDS